MARSPVKKQAKKGFTLKHFVIFVITIFVIIQLFVVSFKSGSGSSGFTLEQNYFQNNTSKSKDQAQPVTNVDEITHTENNSLKAISNHPDTPNSTLLLPNIPSPLPNIPEQLPLQENAYGTDLPISHLPISELPTFAIDESEYILSSMIERTSDSWALHLTTFFVSSSMIDPEAARANKATKIRPDAIGKWDNVIKSLRKVYYLSNGRRGSIRDTYSCRIQISGSINASYITPGEFLPNRQTTDSNANRRQDILRCSLRDPRSLYDHLGKRALNTILYAEIIRSNKILVRFRIPWSRRRTGYLMSGPPRGSAFHAWGGQPTPALRAAHPDVTPSSALSPADDFYLCTPNSNHFFLQKKILHLLEFVQHHVILNTNHIFLSTDFSWGSSGMEKLLLAMNRLVANGKVTIVSEAGDHIDGVGSTGGLEWHMISLINFHLNSCLFLAKGSADYVGIWDPIEFFIPVPPHNTIADVIRSASIPRDRKLHPSDVAQSDPSLWNGGEGWADGDGHPYCYLRLYSQELFSPIRDTGVDSQNTFDSKKMWKSALYTESSKVVNPDPGKQILPTRTMFQAGPYISGVCKLDWEWTGCEGEEPAGYRDDAYQTSCYSDSINSNYIDEQFTKIKPEFPAKHRLDYVVFDRDAKKLSDQNQGYLASFSGFKSSDVLKRNQYVSKFAPSVEMVLDSHYSKQDLFSYLLTPAETHPGGSGGSDHWLKYEDALKTVLQPSPPRPVEVQIFQPEPGYYNFPQDFAKDDVFENPPVDFLPAFAPDYTDVLLSSLIERKHDSWDLHITSFFLNHQLIWQPPKGYGFRRLNPSKADRWRNAFRVFNKTTYRPSGIRNPEHKFTCRIINAPGQEPYEVEGVFLPNALTPDGNANKRVDPFRCLMQDSRWCYQNLAGSDESVDVTILRDGIRLFHFTVPWKTRRTGFLLSSPPEAVSFDPWKAYDVKNPDVIPGSVGGDDLYLLLPGLETPCSQKSVVMYSEFLQHHYLLGVQHVFLGITYSWNGIHMSNFLSAFHSFIDDKLLTVSSQTGDNIDLLYSILGASMDRDNIKVMHVNMHLFLTKGVVDYLAIWDIDEFFIPKLPHNSIMSVVRAVESPTPLEPYPANSDPMEIKKIHKGGRGWADGNAHPFCYIMLFSDVIFSSLGVPEVYDFNQPWAGQKYPHLPEGGKGKGGLGFKKSIVPTRRMNQLGLHMHGACSLDHGFRGPDCSPDAEFCYSKDFNEANGLSISKQSPVPFDFTTYHRFDAGVYDRDTKAVNQQTEATIYHIQLHRPHLAASEHVLNGTENEYVVRFFPKVLSELKRRKFNVLVTLPAEYNFNQRDDTTKWLSPWNLREQYINRPGGLQLLQDLPKEEVISPQYVALESKLPTFSPDGTEVVIGALIERDADSMNLMLSTFFLASENLVNNSKLVRNYGIRPDTKKSWMLALNHAIYRKYNDYGMRNEGVIYRCRISNHRASEVYIVDGLFVPNGLTPDANANRRLDILRCPIQDTAHAYQVLSRSTEQLRVEIYREDTRIAHFSVPWKSRKTGFMLSAPANASTLDLWKGSSGNASAVGSSGMDGIHMCVPGIESGISKKTIAFYAEFFQHHYEMGVSHIHAAVTFTWDSLNMERFMESFGDYIRSGRMSVTSTAGDTDHAYGFLGMAMERDNVKVMNVNICLYLLKGVTDYVGVWDIDEYFIPRPPHHSILDLIRLAEAKTPLKPMPANTDAWALAPKWKGGPGWADGDAHPYCYLMLNSEALYRPTTSPEGPTASAPWIGNRFNREPEERSGLKFKKPIIPTRRIFQSALHMPGGCYLEYTFNVCAANHKGFCYSQGARHRYGLSINESTGAILDFSFDQRFDGLILDKDAKKISPSTEAVIYHFQIHRSFFTSASHVNSTNDYVSKFFPNLRQKFRREGVEVLVTLPPTVRLNERVDEALKWPLFKDEFLQVVSG